MKYCPRCNFTFADFHHVCDFDGAELISAPEPPSNTARAWLLRRCLKSPVLLSAVGLCAVVSSAFLIGYYEVVKQTTSIVKTEPAPTLSVPTMPPAPDSQSPDVSQTGAVLHEKARRSTASSALRTPRTASATLARNRPQSRKTLKRVEVATRTESPQTAGKKDSILTATLKTTWRVLKKPFSF